MEQYPGEEVQRNSQNNILLPLVQLLAELTRGQSITLKNQIFYQDEPDASGAPAARLIQKTIKLVDGNIQYRTHTGIYEITNPYITRSPETEFKHTDLSEVPTFLSDSTCIFTKDGMQIRQNLYNGHTSKKPITAAFIQGSPENNLWVLVIVTEIINYLKEQVKLGVVELEHSTALLNQFAESLITLLHGRLLETKNKSNDKLDIDVHPRDHFGEIVPAAGIKAHSIEFSEDDVTLSFTRIVQMLRLGAQDESRFNAAYAHSIDSMDLEELKAFLDYISTTFQEDLESVVIAFPLDTRKITPEIWGDSFVLNLDLNTKEWLLRTTEASPGYIEQDGELVYPERTINNSFNGSANLNSIITLLGLLGYVSPMYSLRSFE